MDPMECQPSTSTKRHTSVKNEDETIEKRAKKGVQTDPKTSDTFTNASGNTANENETNITKCSTTEDGLSVYDTSGLKTSLHGIVYQVKLLMLFLNRGHKLEYEFDLATEMDAAEKFDDVVFRYKDPKINKWTWRFLQAKHKLDAKITVNDLITTSDNDNFVLSKYFVSFCKIKNKDLFKDAVLKDFIIITNTTFDFIDKDGNDLETKWKGYFYEEIEQGNSLEEDKILGFEKNGFEAKKFRIKKKAKSGLIDMFASYIRLKALDIEEIKKIKDFEFIEKYIVACEMLDLIEKVNATILNSKEKTLVLKAAKKMVELQKEMEKKQVSTNEWNVTNMEKAIENLRKEKQEREISEAINKLQTEANKMKTIFKTIVQDFERQKSEQNIENQLETLIDLKELIKSINANNDDLPIDQIGEIPPELRDTIGKQTFYNIKRGSKSIKEMKRKLSKYLENRILNISTIIEMALGMKSIESYVDTFLDKFRFVINYPDEKDLSGFLEGELSVQYNVLNTHLITSSFEKEMLEFLKSYDRGTAEFYTGNLAKQFFDKMDVKISNLINIGISFVYPEKLKKIGIEFNKNIEELETFLSIDSEEQIFYLITENTRLSAIKVYRTLISTGKYNEKDSLIFMRLRSLLCHQTQEYVLRSFGALNEKKQKQEGNKEQKSFDLLVIECQNKHRNKDEELDLFDEIRTILKGNQTRKVVFIATNNDYAGYCRRQLKYTSVHDDTSFKDLNDQSQDKLLQRKVNFQGTETEFNELIDKGSAKQYDIGLIQLIEITGK
ncbi:uncharacterized protein LOC129570622 [Sitodiplosis mosellana]|uniref:uncharacterized protein LOC129570622 n=1 Tax=Sitodiplosis mosellana TaxID=263140 RepID=UPI002443CED5|nr:uncharacterized protein LOC129570622 [Sitodiplosis mosellana]